MKPLNKITDPRFVKALAHPLRLRILSVLEERAATPKEIAQEVDAPLTHVSYHVRQLAELGLIKLVRTTQVRGAIAHHYRLEARPSISNEAWREAPEIAKRALAGSVLEQVSTQVNTAVGEGGFSRDGAQLSRFPLEVDEQGWQEASQAFERLTTDLDRIQEASRKRTDSHASDARSAVAVCLLFEGAAERGASAAATPEADGSARETETARR